jgi:hypothetical protein
MQVDQVFKRDWAMSNRGNFVLGLALSLSLFNASPIVVWAQGDPKVVPTTPTINPATGQPKPTTVIPNITIPSQSGIAPVNPTIIPLDQNRQNATPHQPVPQGPGIGIQSTTQPDIKNPNLIGNAADMAKFIAKLDNELSNIISLFGKTTDPKERQKLLSAFLDALKYGLQGFPGLANDPNFKDALKLLTAIDSPEFQEKLMTLLQLQFKNGANLQLAKTDQERAPLLAEKANLDKVAQKIFGQIASANAPKAPTANSTPTQVTTKVVTLSPTAITTPTPTTVVNSVSAGTPIPITNQSPNTVVSSNGNPIPIVTQTTTAVSDVPGTTQTPTTLTVADVPTNTTSIRTRSAVPTVTILPAPTNTSNTSSTSVSTSDIKAAQQDQKNKADTALNNLQDAISDQKDAKIKAIVMAPVNGLTEFGQTISGRPPAAARAGAPNANSTPNQSTTPTPQTIISLLTGKVDAVENNADAVSNLNTKIREAEIGLNYVRGEIAKLQASSKLWMLSPKGIALKAIQASLTTSLTTLKSQKSSAENAFVASFAAIAGTAAGDKLKQAIAGKNLTSQQLVAAAVSLLPALANNSGSQPKTFEGFLSALKTQMESEQANLKDMLDKMNSSTTSVIEMMNQQQNTTNQIFQNRSF